MIELLKAGLHINGGPYQPLELPEQTMFKTKKELNTFRKMWATVLKDDAVKKMIKNGVKRTDAETKDIMLLFTYRQI